MEWNAQGRGRKGKPRRQWVDGTKRSWKDLAKEDAEDRERFVKEQDFFGPNDAYCILEKSQ